MATLFTLEVEEGDITSTMSMCRVNGSSVMTKRFIKQKMNKSNLTQSPTCSFIRRIPLINNLVLYLFPDNILVGDKLFSPNDCRVFRIYAIRLFRLSVTYLPSIKPFCR
jgi:hypothetical protein